MSRNITINGHRTSVRLEPHMWDALQEISDREQCTLNDICTLIHHCKEASQSLTSSIRVFTMLYFKAAATKEGHKRAGHGSIDVMRMRGGLIEAV